MPLASPRIAPRLRAARLLPSRRSSGRVVLLLALSLAIGAASGPRDTEPGMGDTALDAKPMIQRDFESTAPLPLGSPSAAPSSLPATNRRPEVAYISPGADSVVPMATMAPLAVERGELTLRWSDTDGQGSGIVTRIVRLEQAPATATACGAFQTVSAVSLGVGDYADGAIGFGPPPTSGCARASLELIDRAGLRTRVASDPLRIRPAVAAPVKKHRPHWTGGINLYRESAFVTQKEFTWCVAASVQMMVNIVKHRTDRTAATQSRMIEYAQSNDQGPYGPGGGTDVTGWTVALRHFGAGKYRAVGSTTAAAALRIAAIAIRQTGRPAGMLVMEGAHAWVLHGFESRTDPRTNRWARITSVRVSGPLYPIQQKNGYDMRPNKELSLQALARYFQPTTIGAMVGKYVVIVPVH
jgi:hypothetical protein